MVHRVPGDQDLGEDWVRSSPDIPLAFLFKFKVTRRAATWCDSTAGRCHLPLLPWAERDGVRILRNHSRFEPMNPISCQDGGVISLSSTKWRRGPGRGGVQGTGEEICSMFGVRRWMFDVPRFMGRSLRVPGEIHWMFGVGCWMFDVPGFMGSLDLQHRTRIEPLNPRDAMLTISPKRRNNFPLSHRMGEGRGEGSDSWGRESPYIRRRRYLLFATRLIKLTLGSNRAHTNSYS